MLNKRGVGIILIICITLLLNIGCNKEYQIITRDFFALNTVINITVHGEPSHNEILDIAIKRVTEIENRMSATISGSDVDLINKNAGKQPVKVNKDTFYVIKKAIKYSEITDGMFDITVLPLIRLWNINEYNFQVPSQEEIEKTLNLINYKEIVIDEEEHTVFLNKEGMAIDLGGIAKGYAVDEVTRIFKENGIRHAIINMGGDISVIGNRADGKPWRVAIQDPRFDNVPPRNYAIVELVDKKVVTSGDYERFMKEKYKETGERYHHIFDPRTGYPAKMGLISTTVIGDSAMEVDILSTAVFIMGEQQGLELIKSLEGIEAIMVTDDKKVVISEGIRNDVEIVKEEYKQKS